MIVHSQVNQLTQHGVWLQPLLSVATIVCLLNGSVCFAQDAKSPLADLSQSSLRDDQLAISGRFARFERMLSQMADVLGRQIGRAHV